MSYGNRIMAVPGLRLEPSNFLNNTNAQDLGMGCHGVGCPGAFLGAAWMWPGVENPKVRFLSSGWWVRRSLPCLAIPCWWTTTVQSN